MRLPEGFRLELIASEPLVRQPSGVCWDEQGRLFVSELHGYNLEGQYDIDELNQTGQLDREVRRIQASPRAKEAALAGTFGVVKLLRDTDGDGRMDQAQVFADGLPPCYGLCPARGGLIVACAPDIIFLADRDGDGRAEIRETLFTGFGVGALERGINDPEWGLDDWIYFGRGHGGGEITGPRLPKPVRLGGTDFRIKADGTAIEPVLGSTHTFGHAFTEAGERFTITTSRPGIYVTPIPWRYLARNPDAAAPPAEQTAGDYTRVFPISPPHPWRVKRAEDPGFYKYYRDRYGVSDSDAGGYFTSGCSPLVYQDVAFPAEYRGQYFMCEPAQNLVHRAVIERRGPELRLRRAPGDEASEFLASSDSWFHPMAISHSPDGSLFIVDMYREIIEDYSAIPRYLQQQYGLTNGMNHGRLWRLTHRAAPAAPEADMSQLSIEELVKEAGSPHFWRRQTARRLLVERQAKSVGPALAQRARESSETAPALNALYTLAALDRLTAEDAAMALKHASYGVRIHGLRLAERWLDANAQLLDQVLALAQDPDEAVALQAALTLGESKDERILSALASLARSRGAVKWMPAAILSSIPQKAGDLLADLLSAPDRIGQGTHLLEPLAATLGARRNPEELGQTLGQIAALRNPAWQTLCLRGLQAGLKSGAKTGLSRAGRAALEQLSSSNDAEVRSNASALGQRIHIADPAVRRERMAQAAREAADIQLPPAARLSAIAELASFDEAEATSGLLSAWPFGTPKVREAILDSVFQRRDRLPRLVEAMESGTVPAAALTAVQRTALLEHKDLRDRAQKLLAPRHRLDGEKYGRYMAALDRSGNPERGEQVFREHCSACHQVRGLGFAVGPDLGAEFQRADEALLQDILSPSDTITAGYATYVIDTTDGQTLHGILTDESATSLTLRQAAGAEQVVLRKNIAKLSSLPVSLMPEALAEALQPRDVADLAAWLKKGNAAAAPQPEERPASRLVPIELTCVDPAATGYATFQSHNQKVVSNRRGIFMTHIRTRNEPYTAQTWRLSWSTNNGASFTTVHEETNATNPPVIETDAEDNLYVIRPDFVDGHAYLYRFFARENYRHPKITQIPQGSAGKYSMILDAGRGRLAYFAHNNTFHLIGLDGTILRFTRLLTKGKSAILQYPLLSLSEDRTLHAAWTTQAHGRYLYWDIHYLASPDGGLEWRTLEGANVELPVVADEGGPANRVTLDDEFSAHTWLSSFLAKSGKLHFLYLAQTTPPRQHYMRYDLKSGQRELDISPEFRGRTLLLRSLDGFFASRASDPGARLYCISRDAQESRLACLASDDQGATWYDYAVSDPVGVPYSIGGCREISEEGYILGSFTEQLAPTTDPGGGSKVHFFKIKAGATKK